MVAIEDYKIKPSKKIVDDLVIQIIYIPLESKLGYEYTPTVNTGDYVCIGSVVGKNAITEIPLLSSVSGTVVGFEEKYISNGKLVNTVVIENDFKEKYLDKVGKTKDITKYSRDEFIYLIKKMGIVGMSGNDFPTYIKYDTNKKIKSLIVNSVECEIYASSDNAVIYNYTEEILEAIDAIMEIMKIDKAYIAVKSNNEIVIKKLLKHINTYPNIKVFPIMDAYPSGYERYLVKEILGLSYNKLPIEVGAICSNVSTIYAIYEAMKYHKPLIDRVVTISGVGIKNPSNYRLKIGTNLNEIVMKKDIYKKIDNPILIAGGAMMGTSIKNDNLIVTKDLGSILVLSDDTSRPSACIKCGKCSEVCPMNLIPSLIIEDKKNAKNLKIDKCIGCGLCSYVCPSKIEVRELIEIIKGETK